MSEFNAEDGFVKFREQGHHGTHVESPSNRSLEDICERNKISFLKNWTILSSSPHIARNNTYPLSDEESKVLMIVRNKLVHLLSSQEGISNILSSDAHEMLRKDFDDEVQQYVSTIQDISKKDKVVNNFYDLNYSNQNSLRYRILAILEWVQINAEGPVGVI